MSRFLGWGMEQGDVVGSLQPSNIGLRNKGMGGEWGESFYDMQSLPEWSIQRTTAMVTAIGADREEEICNQGLRPTSICCSNTRINRRNACASHMQTREEETIPYQEETIPYQCQ